MNEEYNDILEQAAQRLVEAFKRPKEDLTIKIAAGKIKSIGENHSTAIVDLGSGSIKALNKSGDKLMVGESVWVGYITSLADAVILFRTGLSVPPGGGGGGSAVIGNVTIRSNGTYRAEAAGYDGFGVVEVDVPTVTPLIGQIDKAFPEGGRMTITVNDKSY